MKFHRIKDPWTGPSSVRLGLALRGSFGVCTLGCGYFALQQLGLGDASAIGFLSPTFTGLLAFLILKEPWTRTDFLASLCALVGSPSLPDPDSSSKPRTSLRTPKTVVLKFRQRSAISAPS
ncbi:hypothetical protein BJ742DRAFT_418159 [Cladochytrium replicatum]|nr:hypothetical protein BJ742DRAFT_418159 [Cladochytrium replicatum]